MTLVRGIAITIGLMASVVLGLLMLMGTQAATSSAQAYMGLGSVGLPIVGYIVAVFFHEGVGGGLMIAGVVPLAVFSLLETGDLGNTLIWIGPFIVPGLLFLYHYIEKDQRTAGFE